MTQNTSSLPQEPVRIFRLKIWQFVVIALLLGCIIGGGAVYTRMSAAHARAFEIGYTAALIAHMQDNLRKPTREEMNGILSNLRATTAELGRTRHSLDPLGVMAWDMYPSLERQDATAKLASSRSFPGKFTR